MGASFVATTASAMLESTGGHTVPFLFLLGLAVVFFALNLRIMRP